MGKDDKPSLLAGDQSMVSQSRTEKRSVVKRPTLAFLLSLAAGVAMITFSSGLATFTQYYFITTVIVQDSFILGLATIFVGALGYLRPDEHTPWSLVMISLGVSELVLVTGASSSIPLLQLSPVGPIAGILAVASGAFALGFKPEIIRFAADNR